MKRKLTKSNRNTALTGTLTGTGEYIGIDSTVIRVLCVFLSLVAFGNPIILYILSVPIIPSARSVRTNYRHNNAYYEKNNYREQTREQAEKHKEAEKIGDGGWSDF